MRITRDSRSTVASILHLALGLVMVAAVPASAIGQATAAPPVPASLTGAWELTSDAGAPPEDLGRPEGAPARGATGGPPPGGGSGMGGRGGGYGGMGGGRPPGGGDGKRPSKEEMQRARDLMRELMELPRRLTITQDGTIVNFTSDDGRVVKYEATGRPEKHQLTNATVETKTRWDQGTLVIETSVKDGPKIVRRFTVEPEPKRLVVTTRMDGGPRQMPEQQSYYEPIPDAAR